MLQLCVVHSLACLTHAVGGSSPPLLLCTDYTPHVQACATVLAAVRKECRKTVDEDGDSDAEHELSVWVPFSIAWSS